MDERILKYCDGQLSKQDQECLLKEAQNDPNLKKLIIEYQRLHSLLGLVPEKIDALEGSKGYADFKSRVASRKRRALLVSFGRYAAVLVLSFISAWILSSFYFSKEGFLSKELIASRQELVVPPGQRAELTLPDGTKVWLNAGSRLSYPSFFTNERKVFLSGEGFFDVAKNETSPFIVSTQTIDVKAIGTRFNVFSYPDGDYTGVFLQEGKVKAYFPSEEAKGIVLLPEQYLVQKDGRLELSVMDSDELLWREGIYTFKKQKLGNIIKKLELYYDVEIVVSDPEILRYEYVGKFRQRDGVMEILRVIQRIHGFKIRRHEEENRIVLSK